MRLRGNSSASKISLQNKAIKLRTDPDVTKTHPHFQGKSDTTPLIFLGYFHFPLMQKDLNVYSLENLGKLRAGTN